jgi:hypothetical protein
MKFKRKLKIKNNNNALSAGIPGQSGQMISEPAGLPDLVPEPPSVYREAIQAFQLK